MAINEVTLDSDTDTKHGFAKVGYFPDRSELLFEVSRLSQTGGGQEEVVDVDTSR